MSEKLICIKLTRDMMIKYWKTFLEIDSEHVNSGALEEWGEENFFYELTDKWELSSLVHIDFKVLGYRIASGRGKYPGYAHSHRTSIDPHYIRMGMGKLLLNKSITSAKSLGYKGLTGLVNINNTRSKIFLESTGWKDTGDIVQGNELWVLNF